jgi:FKBP-type peptidyl-prolyl cis-trans isomerase FkpA/FKBP-type peptidyl-prolyl cis-trans isomerase FklB
MIKLSKEIKVLIGLAVITVVVAIGLSLKKGKDAKVVTGGTMEKVSYAIGNQIGANLQRQGIGKIDTQILAEAIEDVFNGKNKLSAEESQKAMMELQKSIMEKMQKKAEANKTSSDSFLKENKGKEGVKTTASGLQYVVEKAGTGKSVKKESTVKMHYTGTLSDGTQFDSSFERKAPAIVKVSSLVKGWAEGLEMMKEGSKVKLFIPPDLAYGQTPTPRIPPNSTLIIEVEVLEVK